MTFTIVQIIVGLIALTYGADRFVDGASGIARELKVPPLLIGLTIVAFATSAPEMIVSATAAMNGNPGIALGNAIGSNVANVALVLGTTALILPLIVKSRTLRKEFSILWLVMLACFVFLYDLKLTRAEAIIMLIGLFMFMIWIVFDGLKMARKNPPEFDDSPSMPIMAAVIWTALGLILLVFGGRWLVEGAVTVAQQFGVSDTVIGLTIVAIGTSLPELAASVAGALKKEPDIAIGNVIGSNVFNLLGVMGIAGVLHPLTFAEELLRRDYTFMLLVTGLLFGFIFWEARANDEGILNRVHGTILLLLFIGYMSFLAFSGQ